MNWMEWYQTLGAIAGFTGLALYAATMIYGVLAMSKKDTPTPDEKPVAIGRYRERRHR